MEIGVVIKDMLTPELLPLIAVLYLIGMGLKKTEKVSDKYIPMILGGISIAMNALYIFATTTVGNGQEIAGAILTTIIQGVLFAGASVYFNQIYKQTTTQG